MASVPNFFIIGAPKAGTSSLYQYLRQHPQVYMSPIKEPHFFCSHHFPALFTGPGDEEFSRAAIRHPDAYRALFQTATGQSAAGEASVFYLYYPDTPERIRAWNPKAKVIAILRHPVDRAFSAYMHLVRDGWETLSFEEALQVEEDRIRSGYRPLWWYRQLGLYSDAIARYQRVFPPEQMQVFLYEDFANPNKVVQEVLRFLGLNTEVPIDTTIRHNTSGVPRLRPLYMFLSRPHPVKEWAKRVLPTAPCSRASHWLKNRLLVREDMNPTTRQSLLNFYAPDIVRLQELLDRDLSAWLDAR
ncbi:MAG: sulfotransferase [Alicyclobacillus herbarius]|uniref:sulfotransferase family protein n=1 Tax=Alicyclobacillus herbarius TaxID=122960 RepID=UPI002355812E|nr:sulfotransferase [Alicyclobacillus herbarius]MCL6632469.1 sulfotransferase [Alicyclobacillus herbarius]